MRLPIFSLLGMGSRLRILELFPRSFFGFDWKKKEKRNVALKNKTRRRQIVTEFTCFLRLQWSINSIRSRNMMENLLKRKHQPFFSVSRMEYYLFSMKLSMLKGSLSIRPFYAQKSTVGCSIPRWNKNMTGMRNLLQGWKKRNRLKIPIYRIAIYFVTLDVIFNEVT